MSSFSIEHFTTGWDLVYDNGFIEIDPSQCGYTTFLGAGVPDPTYDLDNDIQKMDRQMDTYIDGWMDGWMDGLTDG